MHKKFFMFLGLFAAMASISLAQPNTFQNPTATKLISGSQNADPWGLLETEDEDDTKKAAGVKSSVIVNMTGVERSAFDRINEKRVEMGLPPLVWNNELAAVARVHSQNMADFKFFSHRGLDNKLDSDRADQIKRGTWRSSRETRSCSRPASSSQ